MGNPDTTASESATADFFLSFQKNKINWSTSSGNQQSNAGFFMNVPTNNAIEDFESGTGGYKVEFIDRGVGRWY